MNPHDDGQEEREGDGALAAAERLRRVANSRKHRGTTMGSDMHVLLAERIRLVAAIQRVQALCASDGPRLFRGRWWVRRADIYRALDGDTTEEARAWCGSPRR